MKHIFKRYLLKKARFTLNTSKNKLTDIQVLKLKGLR